MARGWASKDSDDPQDLQDERRRLAQQTLKTTQEVERQSEIEDLHLQRTRVLHDLQVACNPRYRAMLEESLRFLEDKIKSLQN